MEYYGLNRTLNADTLFVFCWLIDLEFFFGLQNNGNNSGYNLSLISFKIFQQKNAVEDQQLNQQYKKNHQLLAEHRQPQHHQDNQF